MTIILDGTTGITTPDLTDSSLTSGRVVYAGASGNLTGSAALTFDGTNFTVGYSSGSSRFNVSNNGVGGFEINPDGTASGPTLIAYNRGSSSFLQMTSQALNFVWQNSGTETMRLTSTGLGIGTSSPVSKLEVYNSAVNAAFVPSTASTWRVAQVRNDGTVNANNAVGIAFVGRTDVSPAGIAAVQSTTGGGIVGLSFMYVNSNTTTEGMRLDSSGNLGLGVTPSAWYTPYRAFDIGTNTADANISGGIVTRILSNAYLNNSIAWIYKYSLAASHYQQYQGAHTWWNAPAGTAGNTISFTQAMTLDASGNLGVGTTSPSSFGALVTRRGIAVTNVTGSVSASFSDGANDTLYVSQDSGLSRLTFAALTFNKYAGSELARITGAGDLLIGQTTFASGAGISLRGDSSSAYKGSIWSGVAQSTNSYTSYELYSTNASAYRFYVGLGGTIYATNTTISAISDIRFKENVRDLNVGLAEVMALKPRLYDWKEGKGADIKNARGFIAQEFEEVFPDLIDTWKDPAPEGEDPYKSVRQDLIPVLVKAIQELKAEFDAYKASHP